MSNSKSKDIKQMVIYDIRIDESSNAFVLILVDVEGKSYLPIWIGQFEATSILMELKDVTPSRPFTHDLLHSVIGQLKGKIDRIVVTDLIEGTFYARLHIKHAKEVLKIDCRPSDAVSLAVRARVPIFVKEKVLKEAGITIEKKKDKADEGKELEEFRDFLSKVNPEDFEG